MRTQPFVLALALLAGACGADDRTQGASNGLRADNDDDTAGDERRGPAEAEIPASAEDFLRQCVRGGGAVGRVHVVFTCDSITVYSCKDLSNVVLEFEDGERERFEGLNGQVGTFSGTRGGRIVGVWVKAGANFSGDGPGYGERFDAPDADDCDTGQGGSGGTTGGGGTGGCADNDPDESCGPLGGVGGSGDDDDDNGGEPVCPEGDPRCSVD